MELMLDVTILWVDSVILQASSALHVIGDDAARADAENAAQSVALRAAFLTLRLPKIVKLRESVRALQELVACILGPEQAFGSMQVIV